MAESAMIESTLTPQSVFDPSYPKLIEEGTILSGQGELARLLIVGKITKSTPTTGMASVGNVGNGTMTGVSAGLKTKLGIYTALLKSLDGGTLTSSTTGTANVGNTGNGTCASVTAGAKAIAGTYTLICQSKTGGTLTVPTTGMASVGNTGNGTCSSVTGGSLCKAGTYTLTCIAAAAGVWTFEVKDPDSITLGQATVGVAYVSSQINFTIADGDPHFVVGDSFTITTTDGGTFSVKSPNGSSLPNAQVGVAYENEQINFTIADGSTDFVVGDSFTITVGNGGLWSIIDPDGLSLPDAKTGVAYVSNSLNFTINDGVTDFVVGDSFTVTVASGSGKWKKAVATNVDGSQEELGVLMSAVDATSSDIVTQVATRGAIVSNNVTYDSSFSLSTVREALRKNGIFLI